MAKIAKTISDGAVSFLMAEYICMAVYAIVFGIFSYFVTGAAYAFSLVIGSVTSMLVGSV